MTRTSGFNCISKHVISNQFTHHNIRQGRKKKKLLTNSCEVVCADKGYLRHYRKILHYMLILRGPLFCQYINRIRLQNFK